MWVLDEIITYLYLVILALVIFESNSFQYTIHWFKKQPTVD